MITESLLVTRARTTTTNQGENSETQQKKSQKTSKLNSLIKINRRQYKGNVVDHVAGQPQHRSESD